MGTILAIVILIGILILLFKVTGFIIGLCGKFLGALLSIIGYILLGIVAVSLIGIAIVVIPFVIIAGIIAIISAIAAI